MLKILGDVLLTESRDGFLSSSWMTGGSSPIQILRPRPTGQCRPESWRDRHPAGTPQTSFKRVGRRLWLPKNQTFLGEIGIICDSESSQRNHCATGLTSFVGRHSFGAAYAF